MDALLDAVDTGTYDDVRQALLNPSVTRVTLNGTLLRAQNQTVLHRAVARGDPDTVHALLGHGCDANAPDLKKLTPWTQLVQLDDGDQKDLVKNVLLQAGAIVPDEETGIAPTLESDGSECDFGGPIETQNESADDFIDKNLLRKAIIVLLAPFGYLIFANGFWFMIQFVLTSLSFYFLAVGYFVSEVTIKPPWYRPHPGAKRMTMKHLPEEWKQGKNPKRDHGIPYEDISFKSGHYTLRGWYAPALENGKKSEMGIVFCHGGGRDRRAFLRHLPMFRRHGFSCLFFDLSEHGSSDGRHRGLHFGMRERYDVQAAAQYMRDVRGFKRIAAIGTSMGASSAIMAAALDENLINVVVAENPLRTAASLQYAHLDRLMGGYFHHNKYSNTVMSLFQLVCSNFMNFRIGNKPSRACQAYHVIGTISPRPVMLLHGTFDEIVPFSHSQQLYERAKEPKELWLMPRATHCMLFDQDPDEYERRVLGFLKKYETG